MYPKNDKKVEQTRHCKKCGCELASTSKRKLCENCRRKRNEKIRNWGAGALAVGYGLIKFGPKILGHLDENYNRHVDTNDDDEEKSNSHESNTL